MSANPMLNFTMVDQQEIYLPSNREKCGSHMAQSFMVHLQGRFSAIREDDQKTRYTDEDTESVVEVVEEVCSLGAAEQGSSTCASEESTTSSQCFQSDIPASPSAPPVADRQKGHACQSSATCHGPQVEAYERVFSGDAIDGQPAKHPGGSQLGRKRGVCDYNDVELYDCQPLSHEELLNDLRHDSFLFQDAGESPAAASKSYSVPGNSHGLTARMKAKIEARAAAEADLVRDYAALSRKERENLIISDLHQIRERQEQPANSLASGQVASSAGHSMEIGEETWINCDDCGKWRRIYDNHSINVIRTFRRASKLLKSPQMSNHFFCSMIQDLTCDVVNPFPHDLPWPLTARSLRKTGAETSTGSKTGESGAKVSVLPVELSGEGIDPSSACPLLPAPCSCPLCKVLTSRPADSADSGHSTPSKKPRTDATRPAPEGSEGLGPRAEPCAAPGSSSGPRAADKGRALPQPLSPEDVTCSTQFDSSNKGPRADDDGGSGGGGRHPKLCEVDLCPLPQPAKRWHTITDKTVAGGRDWTRHIGITICDACFSFFRRNGTFDRSFRKPEETKSLCKPTEPSPSKPAEASSASTPRDKKKEEICAKSLPMPQVKERRNEVSPVKPCTTSQHPAQTGTKTMESSLKPVGSLKSSESKFIAPELSTIPMKARKTDAIYYNSKVGRNGKWCSKLRALRCVNCSCRMDRCICKKKKKNPRSSDDSRASAQAEESSEPREVKPAGESGGGGSESESSEFEIIEEQYDSSNDSMSWEDEVEGEQSERVCSSNAATFDVAELVMVQEEQGIADAPTQPPVLDVSPREGPQLPPRPEASVAPVAGATSSSPVSEGPCVREAEAESPVQQEEERLPIKLRIPRWRLGCDAFLRPYQDREPEQASLDSISEALQVMGQTVRGMRESLSSFGSSLSSEIAQLRQTVLESGEWESLH
eukprot:759257-Hanusia_phi.AAC.2